MSLKQSIVVVSEYTIKNSKGGSRGCTPGDYVMRYMARNGATEDLTPVRLQDTDDYIIRYMARREATDTLGSVKEIKDGMRKAQGYGGVAFGYGSISLSDESLRAASKDIQRAFDDGKTVMKTVLSFDEAYLKEMGVVDPDFEFKSRGDYRGNIDQMKLRKAVMDGLDKMSKDYDDLKYVGVIQVDTAHVHCHLAMVDMGRGNITKDGTQRGKIQEPSKRKLRRGIDMSLDKMQSVRQMTSNITRDKRNVKCFIKKYAHKTMAEHGTPQFLLACLPDDKRLWRASTNRKEMKKPNAIVREYVVEVLNQPNSGYGEAIREINEYAMHRTKREGLSDKEHRQLIKNGQERIIEDCMNGVYNVLKQIPDSERRVRTPVLQVMSMTYEDMAGDVDADPMIEFGFKLRSYSSRLDHHKRERKKYHDAVKLYEESENVSADSKALYEFYKIEEEYNAMLLAKYQHFLSFLPSDDEYKSDFDELLMYEQRIDSMEFMINDNTFKRLSPDSAEDYGLRVYDLHGGQYVSTAPELLELRLDRMRNTYKNKRDDFVYKLSNYGLSLNDDNKIEKRNPYVFDDVKALDLHHLSYDFPYEFAISKVNIDSFVDMTNKRYKAYTGAVGYLVSSGQGYAVGSLPGQDIMLMKEYANKFTANPVFVPPVSSTASGKPYKAHTVSLDHDYNADLKLAVQSTVRSLQIE